MKSDILVQVKIESDYKEMFNRTELTSFARKVLNELQIKASEISFNFVDNPHMQELNYQYRGMDKVTDVLSFTSNEVNPENGFLILGDVVISVPVALSQAKEMHNPFIREIHLLMIHGILHLLGYDHEEENEKMKMFSKQQHLMTLVN